MSRLALLLVAALTAFGTFASSAQSYTWTFSDSPLLQRAATEDEYFDVTTLALDSRSPAAPKLIAANSATRRLISFTMNGDPEVLAGNGEPLGEQQPALNQGKDALSSKLRSPSSPAVLGNGDIAFIDGRYAWHYPYSPELVLYNAGTKKLEVLVSRARGVKLADETTANFDPVSVVAQGRDRLFVIGGATPHLTLWEFNRAADGTWTARLIAGDGEGVPSEGYQLGTSLRLYVPFTPTYWDGRLAYPGYMALLGDGSIIFGSGSYGSFIARSGDNEYEVRRYKPNGQPTVDLATELSHNDLVTYARESATSLTVGASRRAHAYGIPLTWGDWAVDLKGDRVATVASIVAAPGGGFFVTERGSANARIRFISLKDSGTDELGDLVKDALTADDDKRRVRILEGLRRIRDKELFAWPATFANCHQVGDESKECPIATVPDDLLMPISEYVTHPIKKMVLSMRARMALGAYNEAARTQ